MILWIGPYSFIVTITLQCCLLNNRGLKGSKHMEVKYLTIKEKVQTGDVAVEHISTDDMIADPLTKGLRPCVFDRHVISMGLGVSWDTVN